VRRALYQRPFAIRDEFITADDVLSFEVSPTTVITGNSSQVGFVELVVHRASLVMGESDLLIPALIPTGQPITVKWSIRPGARPDSYQYFGVFPVSDTTDTRLNIVLACLHVLQRRR
jgi:hypothetical protein